MLKERGAEVEYREYRKQPLSVAELQDVLGKLGLTPADVLRRRDAANKELKLTGAEAPEVLLAHMAEHPTLLQRPIGIRGDKAVVGRPPERLLELL
ncbi:MAG: arsenate reductase [Myxococcota bacterium]